MTEIARLMDRWFEFHVRHGTLIARTWSPTPVLEEDLANAKEALGGPAWPEELDDLYRWSDGGYNRLLLFGTVASLESVVSGSMPGGYPPEEAYQFLPSEPEGEVENPYPLLISPEYPCVHIDRTGLTPGRLWATDVGDVFEVADSLTEYLEVIVYLAEKGAIDTDESDRYLVFNDLGSSWGPAALLR